MNLYSTYIGNLQDTLDSFIKEGKIESEKFEKEMNKFGRILKEQQFEVLSKPISDEYQNILFNALRNLRLVISEMKDQLKTAVERKENPTTAKRCSALMPFISNLSEVIYEYQKNKNISVMSNISRYTRILRKKSREFNLLASLKKEMREVDLPSKEVMRFFDEFNQNIELEMQEL